MTTTAVDPGQLTGAASALDGAFEGLDLRCRAALLAVADAVGGAECADAATRLGASLGGFLLGIESRTAAFGHLTRLAGAAYGSTEASIAAGLGLP